VKPTEPLTTAAKPVDDFDMDLLAEPAGVPDLAPPSLTAPVAREPVATESTIDLAPTVEIEPAPEPVSDPEILLETTPSSALVGTLEEPARFYKPVVASVAVPMSQAVPATSSNGFAEWIRMHKLYCVIGVILAWVVFAGVQKVLHPIPMSRAYQEEMELRRKLQAAMDERTGKKTDSDASKGKDQSAGSDKAGSDQADKSDK
jgi:hypothetical protein